MACGGHVVVVVGDDGVVLGHQDVSDDRPRGGARKACERVALVWVRLGVVSKSVTQFRI